MVIEKKIDCHMIGNGKLVIVGGLGTKNFWLLKDYRRKDLITTRFAIKKFRS
jgi:hypothetical protein